MVRPLLFERLDLFVDGAGQEPGLLVELGRRRARRLAEVGKGLDGLFDRRAALALEPDRGLGQRLQIARGHASVDASAASTSAALPCVPTFAAMACCADCRPATVAPAALPVRISALRYW